MDHLYVFIFHTDEDIAVERMEALFVDDLSALEAAENLAEHCRIDVWNGERLVAQIKKGNEPLNVKDAHSG
jgi:hypothetical protein